MENLTAISLICHDWDYFAFMASDKKAYKLSHEFGRMMSEEVAEELYFEGEIKNEDQLKDSDYIQYANNHKKTWKAIPEFPTGIEIANNFFATN